MKFDNKNSKYNSSIQRNQLKSDYLIGNWELPHGEILAPMAGITDSPFRRMVRRHGGGLLYTEVISAEGTRRLGKMSLELAHFHPEERPIAVQLFGSEPSQFAEAAIIIERDCQPDLIDINCGCPVKRFVTRSCGGYLMNNPCLIGEIVAAVREAVQTPVSVKLRTGYRKPDATVVEAAQAAVEAGAALVAVHGRWVRGAKGTAADWSVIAQVKEAVKAVPIIGNGDVCSRSDARRMIAETGCDRVMIGRWARGKPWIFSSSTEDCATDEEVCEPAPWEKIDFLLEHYGLMLERYPLRTAVHRMRKQIGWYAQGLRNVSRLRGELMTEEDPVVVQERLKLYRQELLAEQDDSDDQI